MNPLPVIGIPACLKVPVELPVHNVTDKYVTPVVGRSLPVLIPALGERLDAAAYVRLLDGLLLTGSPSNVEPRHYEGEDQDAGPHDPARDMTTLPLIRACVKAGLPVFAICRGIQELNVALGGSLHQRVHALEGRFDHRSRKDVTLREKYRVAHPVRITPGGRLHRLLGQEEVLVNSLHGQGIDRLAPGLTVEAVAPDGIVEAVSVTGATTFQMGFQWHPEWPDPAGAVSAPLFDAFLDACAARAGRRLAAAAD